MIDNNNNSNNNSNNSDDDDVELIKHKKLRTKFLLNISNFKKFTAIIVIAAGFGFLGYGYLNSIIHFINLGIGLLLIGWVLLSFSYEKYLRYNIGSSVFNDYMDLVGKLIKSLDIKNSGIIIPPRENLKNGAIFLPLNENFKINFGLIDDSVLFVNSDNKKEMGIVFTPLGKSLINILKKYDDLDELTLDEYDDKSSMIINIENYLDYSLNLFQLGSNVNVNFNDNKTITVSYKINDNSVCKKLQKDGLCKKCPCPVCGFIVLSIAKSLNRMLKIEEIIEDNRNIIIKLNVLDNNI
ncbi:hypothetical protein [Methanothermococcus okinawensis]|uniref:DUF7982 domain-containing protein n=1 Tax=Methanothermococcus okinawensis (strain DSM 14208 / JCM 11175 / IH1) TaxID=647113 RepID=F8AK12_METOI|nr:hypothetical protein [Methanothermococcus okinawensis]AEH07372.1 hypothetical protein Metok_1407 [Methanothermococcus okinawensis IH1]